MFVIRYILIFVSQSPFSSCQSISLLLMKRMIKTNEYYYYL